MRHISYTLYMIRFFVAFALLISLTIPAGAQAAFEVSGWIPYWAVSDGTKSARENIEALSVVMPFSYTVQQNGGLKDLGGMKKSAWKRLIKEADKNNVAVLPTVMTGDGALVHTLLSDADAREDHVEEIVRMVEKGGYDGVDIDYEGKRSATRIYFSQFLKELEDELDGKILSCTIEARTPPDSLYRTVPQTIEYANDLVEINRHCDRVNVMAYDQQRADLKLNDARKGSPYYPNADIEWVEKVMTYMARDIDKDKLVLGVPTYGRELEVTVSPQWFQSYTQLWSVNPEYAEKNAKKVKVKASENKAGEKSYTYLPKKSPVRLSDLPKAPKGTPSGEEVAQRALLHANETGETVKVNMVWWSDADAVEDKVNLAKRLGLLGVAIFKIDGGEDEDIWEIF